ncbi:13968_t:CDS:2 [Gigaspora margarita]|uniref:13968_t:CDS:1 n=1 Tax=Gigaspora margarita TaxID=4874 RepID=A0ABM8VZ41_GIGMA|nr:13968_t:CDS:2 [Gigaspora margarita]
MDNYEDADRDLLKKKWSLAFELCLKESTNQDLLEWLSNDVNEVTYFIEELKEYNDLYLVENVKGKKVNEVWDEAINSLSGKPFSTKHQIIEFIIREVYNASFLNMDEIIYLLERLQNAENNILNKNLNICKIDFIWNVIIEKFYEETFSTDQHASVYIYSMLDKEFSNTSTSIFKTTINNEKLDKRKIDFIWNIICRMLVKRAFFANGIINLNKGENAFFLARFKVSITLCVNFQSPTLKQEVLFLSQQIFNDKILKEEERIYLLNYLQNDYRNDIECSIFSNIKKAKNHILKYSEIELSDILIASDISLLNQKLPQIRDVNFWMKDDESIKIYEESNKIMIETCWNKLKDNVKQAPDKYNYLFKQWSNLYQMFQVDRHSLKEQEYWETYKLILKDDEFMKIYEKSNKLYESSVIITATQNTQVSINQLIDGLFIPTPVNSIEISEFDLNKFKPDTNASINLHKSNFREYFN